MGSQSSRTPTEWLSPHFLHREYTVVSKRPETSKLQSSIFFPSHPGISSWMFFPKILSQTSIDSPGHSFPAPHRSQLLTSKWEYPIPPVQHPEIGTPAYVIHRLMLLQVCLGPQPTGYLNGQGPPMDLKMMREIRSNRAEICLNFVGVPPRN